MSAAERVREALERIEDIRRRVNRPTGDDEIDTVVSQLFGYLDETLGVLADLLREVPLTSAQRDSLARGLK